MNQNTNVAVSDTQPSGKPSASQDTSTQVHQFVDALYEPSDILEFRILPSRQSRWTRASTVDEVVPWLIKQNNSGQSIYVGCNPRSCEGDGSTAEKCTGCGRCTKCVALRHSLCIDIEHTELTEFHFKFKECDLPAPTVTMTSGAGIHCYWRLDADLEPEQWRRHQKGIIQAAVTVDLDVDLKIHDPPRVMRVPGFINHKRKKPSNLISVTKLATYPIDEFPIPPESHHHKSNGKSNGTLTCPRFMCQSL